MRNSLLGPLVLVSNLCACLFSLCAGAKAETLTDGFWIYQLNGGATVVGYTGPGGAVVIPSEIAGHPVTQLGRTGVPFFQDKKLPVTSLTVPEGVTDIGGGTFANCSGLVSVSLPESLAGIGEAAFFRCTALTSIVVPGSVNNIPPATFMGCTSLESVTLGHADGGGGVAIEDEAFAGCTRLTNVSIRGHVFLSDSVFSGCTSLESIQFPESLELSGSGWDGRDFSAFAGCTSLTNISVSPEDDEFSTVDGVLFDKDGTALVRFPPGKTGAYRVPDGVRTIESGAFAGSVGLTSVSLPEGVTGIDWAAFFGCSALTNIVLPSTLDYIEQIAFYGCEQLSSIELPEGISDLSPNTFARCPRLAAINVSAQNDDYASVDGVVFSKDLKTLVRYPPGKEGAYTIPTGVSEFGEGGGPFLGCVGLTHINVDPDHPELASLDGVLFSKDLTTLIQYPPGRKGAYRIPESVRDFEWWPAFAGCTGLTIVEIPSGLTSLGDFPFSGCANLNEIRVDPGNPELASLDGVLFSKDRATLIKYPPGRKGTYRIPDSVLAINEGAFASSVGLTTVHLPEGLREIGGQAFAGCATLEELTLPRTLRGLGYNAFADCDFLQSVVVLGSSVSFPDYTFADCFSLESILWLGEKQPNAESDSFLGSPITHYYSACEPGWFGVFSGGHTIEGRPVEKLSTADLRDFVLARVQESPHVYGLYPESEYAKSRTEGQADVTGNPSAFNLFTQGQLDSNRTAGQQDVITAPAVYNLFTQAQYDTVGALRFAEGQSSVVGDPSAYGLYSQAQFDGNRAAGRLDVITVPAAYGLYTKAQYDAFGAEQFAGGEDAALAALPAVNIAAPATTFVRVGLGTNNIAGVSAAEIPEGWEFDASSGEIYGRIDEAGGVSALLLGARNDGAPVPFAFNFWPQRPQKLAFTVKAAAKVGQTIVLSATASSQLPVSIESSDPTVVRIDENGTATALKPGRVELTATQGGDENYSAAKPVVKKVTVK